MSLYFNEFDPFAAGWLRNLYPGATVDERSIADVDPTDVMGFERVHWFGGIAGWQLALDLAGWRGPVWTGSCPCQPLSCAGYGRGEKDERHLWPELYRLISECGPAIVFGEQVASNDGLEWLDGISLDLEELGYAVGASDLPAACVSAPHIRQRVFWVAHRQEINERRGPQPRDVAGEVSAAGTHYGASPGRSRGVDGLEHTDLSDKDQRPPGGQQPLHQQRCERRAWDRFEVVHCGDGTQRRVEPGTLPLVDGVPRRLDKIRGYGNAIVPQVAAVFIRAVMEVL